MMAGFRIQELFGVGPVVCFVFLQSSDDFGMIGAVTALIFLFGLAAWKIMRDREEKRKEQQAFTASIVEQAK